MAVRTKVGSFQVSTGIAGTVQSITGIGFNPIFVKFHVNGRTDAANAIGNASHQFGIGIAVNPNVTRNNISVGTKSQDATGGVSNSSSDVHELRAINTLLAASNTGDGEFSITAWNSDGFDLTIDNQFATAVTIHYKAFIGNFSIENIVVTEPAVAGNVNMVFAKRPDHLFVFANASGAFTGGIADDSRMMVGAASFRRNAIQQFVCAYGANDNVNPTNTQSFSRFDKFIAHLDTNFGANLTGQASITSISGTTVVLNFDVVSGGGNREHIVYGITGEEWEVGNFDTVTAGNNIVVTGLGFRPEGIDFYSTTRGQDAANTPGSPDERVVGFVDSAGVQHSLTIEDSTGIAGTTRVSTAIQFDSIYASTNGAAGPAIDARITYTSRQNNGFTLAQPTSDGAGRDVYYIACGNSPISAQLLTRDLQSNRNQIGSPAARSF